MTVKTSAATPARRVPLVPRDFDAMLTGCFFLVLLALACLMPMQNDTWWHLRTGQEMWNRRFIMLNDEFSFTAYGARWMNHEWLSAIVFYAIYRVAGLPGLTLFAAAAVTLAAALAWRLMAGPVPQRLLVLGVALTAIVPVWTVRPHVFTLVLLMVVLHLALRERYWPIPPLFFLWANLHGGVAMGFVALGGVILGRLYSSGPSAVRAPVLVALISFAATFLTPLGAALWWTIPESIHKSTTNQIIEWQPASLFASRYLAFWGIAALLCITTVILRRHMNRPQHAVLVAVALAILPLAIRYRRNIPPFLLVATPALSQNLAPWLQQFARAARDEKPALNAAVFLVCAIACVAMVAAAWTGPAARLMWHPIPAAVVSEAESCGDRVYNLYADGGYLIWFAPGVRVFIDSRQDPYPLEFIQEYLQIERTGNYRAAFEHYEIRCAVLPTSSLTARRLLADGWRTRTQLQGWIVLESGDGAP